MIFVFVLILLTIFGLCLPIVYNISSTKRAEYQEFLKGIIPAQLPDGKYTGSASVNLHKWQGKNFDRRAKTGINRFEYGEKYRFSMYLGKGLRDTKLEVVKIDYNQSGNPFWLRLVTDEIVEVKPNEFLGKIQVQVIPGFVMTYGYFRLKK